MLYESKQAAALWFNLLNTFLLKLGFIASSMDPCFYRRVRRVDNVIDDTASKSDAIIILHVDDMRVAAEPDVLQIIHDQLYAEFQITTSDCSRFLGMDTTYDIQAGVGVSRCIWLLIFNLRWNDFRILIFHRVYHTENLLVLYFG